NAAIFQAADIMHKDKEIRFVFHFYFSVSFALSTATADSQASGLPFLLMPTSMEYFLLSVIFIFTFEHFRPCL
ncbi:hypothetical protein ACJX0J_034040, partial [Zea mays]